MYSLLVHGVLTVYRGLYFTKQFSIIFVKHTENVLNASDVV